MKKVFDALASLKLTVILLIALLGALAAGTMVESARGTDAAGQLVYYAGWFQALLALLAVNTACAIAKRWPPGNHRIGFLLTHTALLLILVGALATAALKTEGSLALWEGQEGNQFALRDGAQGSVATLPFSIRLDSFEIDTYPGTMRPAMFRSRVTVTDRELGTTFPAVIQMNQELTYRGVKFFQSSYQQSGGREMSILTVSRDPGKLIVFLGYFLLLGGMATVLGTRIVQARALARRDAERAAARETTGRARRAAAVALPLLLAAALAAPAPAARAAATVAPPEVVAAVRTLPVQHDGRVMPLDTLAREAVWNVTGAKAGWQGQDPVAVVLGWAFAPQDWTHEPVVKVGSGRLAAAAGLAGGPASFAALAGNPQLMQLIAQAHAAADHDQPLTPVLKDAQKLEGRLLWMQSFLQRDALRVLPPADVDARWDTLPANVDSAAALADWYQARRAAPPAGWPAFAALGKELTYNHVRPSRLAWWILLPATLLALAALLRPRRALDLAAVVALTAGFAVMTWGIAVRWQVAGRIPASNMYESMLFLAWGVGLFALVAAALLRNRLVIFNAAAMSALTMMLVDLLPVDPFIHPIAPVLAGTPWLAIHVPIIMVSYSVLALGVLIAHMQVGLEIFAPARRAAAARMNQLLYWYMHVGSLLLAAGIITGSIWAASSWGRYWGWDPKEVWSLIAFLAYMAILHSRFDRQIGAFGVAAASIVAFWAVLMTYLGVNFVLTTGLHSYGFGSGGLVEWMAGIGVLELVFLAAGYVAHRRSVAAHGPLVAAGI